MVKSREQKKISLLWHTGNKKDNKACDTKPYRQHHVLQEFNMGRIVEVLEGIYKKAVFDTVHWFIHHHCFISGCPGWPEEKVIVITWEENSSSQNMLDNIIIARGEIYFALSDCHEVSLPSSETVVICKVVCLCGLPSS